MAPGEEKPSTLSTPDASNVNVSIILSSSLIPRLSLTPIDKGSRSPYWLGPPLLWTKHRSNSWYSLVAHLSIPNLNHHDCLYSCGTWIVFANFALLSSLLVTGPFGFALRPKTFRGFGAFDFFGFPVFFLQDCVNSGQSLCFECSSCSLSFPVQDELPPSGLLFTWEEGQKSPIVKPVPSALTHCVR